jgi:NAD(P)-dependent dehydrogenase (short-subunit alcohol dehydrogenase family)
MGTNSENLMEKFLEIYKRLNSENIDVSLVCPGFVKTPLTDNNESPMPWQAIIYEKESEKGLKKYTFQRNLPTL